MERFDAIVIGAGAAECFVRRRRGSWAAGCCCSIMAKAGAQNPDVRRRPLQLTNMYVEPAAYLSQNPHFANLRWRAIPSGTLSNWLANMVLRHEKTLGQLFCDDSAEQIVNLLLSECEKGGVQIRLRSEILSVERDEQGYRLQVNGETLTAKKLVIASGGLSMPGLGASPFGYKVAEQFGLKVLPTRAGLVPLPCINRCLSSCRCFPAFRCLLPLPPRTVRCFAKTCYLPIVAFPARRCCRFPATGSPASLSPSTCCRTAILRRSSTSSGALIPTKA